METSKKRIRKKTCEINSIEKLKIETVSKSTKNEKTLKKPIEKNEKNEDVNQSQISFGKFNITVKKTPIMSSEELRKYYDEKFKINDSEKTAKLMTQDSDSNVYEPIMENDTCIKTEKCENFQENIKVKICNKHKILSKFIQQTKQSWPTSTDILCWWCSHSFDNAPLACPSDYDDIRDRYKTNGVFCSWSCVAAYSIKEYQSLEIVYRMKNELNSEDKINGIIYVAPSRYILKNFGGYMDINNYRSLDTSKNILISTENISYINQDIIEINGSSIV